MEQKEIIIKDGDEELPEQKTVNHDQLSQSEYKFKYMEKQVKELNLRKSDKNDAANYRGISVMKHLESCSPSVYSMK